MNYKIIGYFRYVDDIVLFYNKNITDVHEIFSIFNSLSQKLKFTIEEQVKMR
jgi:hypothetical protein